MPLLLMSFSEENNSEKKKMILRITLEALNQTHHAPRNIDDKFSEDLFNLYLKRIDFRKNYLIQEDVSQLERYKKALDEQCLMTEFDFYNSANQMLDKRTAQVEQMCNEILAKPFTFEGKGVIETDPDKLKWPTDIAALRQRWEDGLKFQVLSRVYDRMSMQEDAVAKKDTSVKIKSMEEAEVEARQKVKENLDEQFKRIRKQKEMDRFSYYINAITAIYDPHTNFFPPAEKKSFDISMSGKLEGIGAKLSESGGFIKVAEIVPGSPSWKNGELQVNDVILKVAQGAAEPLDIVDMPLDEAITFIRGKKGTEVRLTVKKPDGSQKVISLIRDVIELEETFARSLVIELKGTGKKIGYLQLPKFYVDFDNPNGRRCSTDFLEELNKLKKEKVDGLIVDLRNNGGGSLSDVVKMAGNFVAKGPMVQQKSRNNNPIHLDDPSSSVDFEKPLIVLVNHYSASASEIFAAAMQDYKRAIIIGPSCSFGKGTVQNFFDLDNALQPGNPLAPLGQVKVTISKFYRINGGTTQRKGVIPDIILPDPYNYIPTGEREEEFNLVDDNINPAKYELWPNYSDEKFQKALKNSKGRVAGSTYFQSVEKTAKRLKVQRDNSTYSLNYNAFANRRKAEKKEASDEEKQVKVIEDLLLRNLEADKAALSADAVAEKKNNQWIDGLKKDNYLFEALKVMQDLL